MSRQFQKRPEIYHFTQLLAPIAYDDDDRLFLLDGNQIGFGFICDPLPGADPKAADRLNVLLNQDFPIDSVLQIALHASHDTMPFTGHMERLRFEANTGGKTSDISRRAQHVVEQMRSHITRHSERPYTNGTGVRIRDIKIIITAQIPIASQKPTKDEWKEIIALRDAMENTIRASGIGGYSMDKHAYARIVESMLNWQPSAEWRTRAFGQMVDDEPIRDQIIDHETDIELQKDRIIFGTDIENGKIDKVAQLLSVKRYPEIINFGLAARYLMEPLQGQRGIRENMVVAATIIFDDPTKAKDRISRDRVMTNHQAFGPMVRFNPKLKDKQTSHEALLEAFDDGDRPVRMYLGFVIFSDPKDEDAALSAARTYLREIGLQVVKDSHVVLPLFLTCLPFGTEIKSAGELFRFKTMATRHAVDLLPLFGEWKGTGTPVVPYTGRSGQAMSFDLFDSESNFNAVIAGESGAGKSFNANWILTNYLSTGARVWIIDIGRSYEKLSDAVGGEFIVFSEDSKLCLNPFPMISNFPDQVEMLALLITSMAAPTEKLSDFQTSRLQRHITDAWNLKGKETQIDDIAERCKSDDDRRIKDIGDQLFPFTTEGQYGPIFNGENNVDFNSDLIVLELEELNNKPHLQAVILLQLIFQIQNQMYLGDRDKRKILMVDESWALMNSGNMGQFMVKAWRTLRKANGSGILGTQSVNDLYQSDNGVAMAENSANMIIMSQNNETIASLEKGSRLEIGEWGFKLLRKVHTQRGRYSEMLLKTDHGVGVAQLVTTKPVEVIFSTKAEDVASIKNIREQRNIDTIRAIDIYCQEQGFTVADDIDNPIYSSIERASKDLSRCGVTDTPLPMLQRSYDLLTSMTSSIKTRIKNIA